MLPPPITIATSTPLFGDGDDLFGVLAQSYAIDAVGLVAHQAFAGELQEDALVLGGPWLVVCGGESKIR